MPPDVYSRSSIPNAMAAINMKLLPKKYHEQENINLEHPVTINDQLLIRQGFILFFWTKGDLGLVFAELKRVTPFLIFIIVLNIMNSYFRVQKKSDQSDVYSPTPEGIHQDNTEISSVTLINRFDVTHGGETRLWSNDTPAGNYTEDEFHQMGDKVRKQTQDFKNLFYFFCILKLILDYPLQHQWESVFFNDRVLKHEARAFHGGNIATRDVLVNFIRKPLKVSMGVHFNFSFYQFTLLQDGTDVKFSMERFVSV